MAYPPKTSWPACADCGRAGGLSHRASGMVTPVRVDGARFGFDGGKLCLTCYNRHAKREWRNRRRQASGPVEPGAIP
jgi:hypothetical protein